MPEQRPEPGFFSREYWQEDNFSPDVRLRVKWAAILATISVSSLIVLIVYVLLT